jgi:hypothetical protein
VKVGVEFGSKKVTSNVLPELLTGTVKFGVPTSEPWLTPLTVTLVPDGAVPAPLLWQPLQPEPPVPTPARPVSPVLTPPGYARAALDQRIVISKPKIQAGNDSR